MERYEQLTFRYLKSSKRRTGITMIGIVLGAILIFGVFSVTFCMINEGRENARQVTDFDVVFYDIDSKQMETIENAKGVETYYEGAYDPYLYKKQYMYFVSDLNNCPFNITLTDGRYPENSNEVLAGPDSAYVIGDSIYFEVEDVRECADFPEPMVFEVVGTFDYVGEFTDAMIYDYCNVGELGIVNEDSDISLKQINAVYVKYDNPYLIQYYSKKIAEETKGKYFVNDGIAGYYYQSSDGSVQALYAALVLTLVVIIAGFSVMVIKNTLRLSVAERLKDYGVLRCAGISIKQLKRLVRNEALLLGLIGTVLGVIPGYLILVIYSAINDPGRFTHFSILAVICTLIVITVTMLVATIDPCKLIAKLTPVEAVRNQMKGSDREVIKARKGRIFTALFGVEGGYAYKNVMTNPKQFITKILVLTLSLVAFISSAILCDSLKGGFEDLIDANYFNIVAEKTDDWFFDTEDLGEESRESIEAGMKELSAIPEVKDTITQVYYSNVYDDAYINAEFISGFDKNELYTDEILNSDGLWSLMDYEYQDGAYDMYSIYLTDTMVGYDESLYSELEDGLVEGTCDPDSLGADDVILVNSTTVYEEKGDYMVEKEVTVYNYHVGDQISFVTCDKDKYEELYQKNLEDYSDSGSSYLAKFATLEELYNEGYVKTYTIKGILSEDAVMGSVGGTYSPQIIMTKQQYMDFFGYDDAEEAHVYNCAHIDNYNEEVYNILTEYGIGGDYCTLITLYQALDKENTICNMVILLVLIFNVINIFNNTASSIVMRKKEFALLRAVGMDKKSLARMILLEGMLAVIISFVLSIVISVPLAFGIYKYMAYLFAMQKLHLPIVKTIIVVLILAAVLALASILPLRSIKDEIAPELAQADE